MKVSPVFILLSSMFWFSMCSTHIGNGNRTPDTINSPKKTQRASLRKVIPLKILFSAIGATTAMSHFH